MKTTKLLSISSDAKTVKGQKKGYLTGVMYLAPAKESGVMNACPSATAGCRAACLFTAGRSGIPRKDGTYPIQIARIARTKFLFNDREGFLRQLIKEIKALEKKAAKKDLIPVVRLNGTSDLLFERLVIDGKSVIDHFPHITFYDYTKIVGRAIDFGKGKLPKNYHLTFSYAETEKNQRDAAKVASVGGNIAVVFRTKDFPNKFLGLPVVNGDESDLRFLDGKGVIVGLKAKGKARKDTTGFVVNV